MITTPEDIEPIDHDKEMREHLLSRRSHSHTHLDTNTFRASSTGNCPRHILISKLGVQKFPAKTQGAFRIGDMIHDEIQGNILPKYMTMHENEVVLEHGDIKIEGVIEAPVNVSLKGHYDCFDGNVVYDYKSQSGGAWWYYNNDNLPKEHHIDQLTVYMAALGASHGLMVYVSKDNMQIETYPDYFGRDTHRWRNRDEKAKFKSGEMEPGCLTEDEHGKLIRFDPERLERIFDKVSKVHEYLETHGFPISISEIDEHFEPCGDCMGCTFEDSNEYDFNHVRNHNQRMGVDE